MMLEIGKGFIEVMKSLVEGMPANHRIYALCAVGLVAIAAIASKNGGEEKPPADANE